MKFTSQSLSFNKLREQGYLYVDKTDLIHALANEGKAYLLCRPPLFGKSLVLSTLKAYFEGKKELFKGLKLESLEQGWPQHKVFFLSFKGVDYSQSGSLEAFLDKSLSSWEQELNLTKLANSSFTGRLVSICKAASEQTGRNVVMLIDDYDQPLIDALNVDKEFYATYQSQLKSFYQAFKAADEYLRFVMLTGVNKFNDEGILNRYNGKDISMHPRFENLCGFSKMELEACFKDVLTTSKAALDENYSCYRFHERQQAKLYHPFALLKLAEAKTIAPDDLLKSMSEQELRLLANACNEVKSIKEQLYDPNYLYNLNVDDDQNLALLYRYGLLSMMSYDQTTELCKLDCPNSSAEQLCKWLLSKHKQDC